MPNTEFDEKLFIAEGKIEVRGPIADPEDDDDVRRAVVFAFVTQQLDPKADAVTVAGEALLYPVDPRARRKPKWWLVCPHSTIEPPAPNGSSKPDPNSRSTHSYHYDLQKSSELGFVSDMDEGNPFQVGPAFGTAILLTFMQDGSIETYAWSGWVEISLPESAPTKP
jgi:hypothetical protein